MQGIDSVAGGRETGRNLSGTMCVVIFFLFQSYFQGDSYHGHAFLVMVSSACERWLDFLVMVSEREMICWQPAATLHFDT